MSLKQQFEDSQEAQQRVCGNYFIRLSKTDPNDVLWVRCAYAYGRHHHNVCTENKMECEDCSNSKCTHIMTKCLECKKNICNSCSWTCRLNAKNSFLAGDMSEFTSCAGCKNTIPPKPVFNPMAQFQQQKAAYRFRMNRRSSDDNSVSFRGGRVTTVDEEEEPAVRPGKLATFHSNYNAFLKRIGMLQKTNFSVSTSPDNDDEWEDNNNQSSSGSGSGEYESNLPSPEGDASSESDYTDNNDDNYDPDPDHIYNYRPSTPRPSAKKLIYDWDEGDDEPTEMWDII